MLESYSNYKLFFELSAWIIEKDMTCMSEREKEMHSQKNSSEVASLWVLFIKQTKNLISFQTNLHKK